MNVSVNILVEEKNEKYNYLDLGCEKQTAFHLFSVFKKQNRFIY